jgi:hypothetical protein
MASVVIVFDLACGLAGHRFEGWFASTEDFAAQQARGLVACPTCGALDVVKAPMAPRLARKGNQVALTSATTADPKQQVIAASGLPPEAVAMMRALAALQAEAIKQSTWVGDKFAEETRAIHYGEREAATIHGQATREEAEDLLDEGIMIAPLLIPVAPPDEVN